MPRQGRWRATTTRGIKTTDMDHSSHRTADSAAALPVPAPRRESRTSADSRFHLAMRKAGVPPSRRLSVVPSTRLAGVRALSRSKGLRAYLNGRGYVKRGEFFGVGGGPAEGVVDGTLDWACDC